MAGGVKIMTVEIIFIFTKQRCRNNIYFHKVEIQKQTDEYYQYLKSNNESDNKTEAAVTKVGIVKTPNHPI